MICAPLTRVKQRWVTGTLKSRCCPLLVQAAQTENGIEGLDLSDRVRGGLNYVMQGIQNTRHSQMQTVMP